MKIKIQILSIFGGVLFELEKENNTQRDTILEAIRVNADLRSADLRYANLRSADLRYANLRSADLQSANLQSADLRSADLQSADLRSANLRSADLQSADLRSADLQSADLRSANLLDTFIQPHCTWAVGMKNDLIKIGCKEKTIEEWGLWFSGTEEYSTKRGTKEFAKIQANYESVKAYVLFMKNFKE